MRIILINEKQADELADHCRRASNYLRDIDCDYTADLADLWASHLRAAALLADDDAGPVDLTRHEKLNPPS